jgi:Na+/proline symporter
VSLSTLDLTVVVVYLAGIIALGLRAARRVNDTQSYFIGSRRFGKILVAAQALTTGTRSDHAISVIGATYEIGLAGIWYQWMWLFTTPFYWILAPVFRRLRVVTTADFYELRFGPAMGVAYTFFALYLFMLWEGTMIKGTATTIQAVSGIQANYIIAAVTITFVIFGVAGGLVAAAVTEFVQGFFILVLSFALVPFGLVAVGGWRALKDKVGENMFSLTAPGEMTLFAVLMLIITGVVGIVAQPHMMAIGSSGKTELSCRIGWCYGNFIKRLCTIGWALAGLIGMALFPGLGHARREEVFGLTIASLLPTGLVGLMIASLMATVLAGCGSFMVNAAALFTRNVYQRYLKINAPDQHYLLVGRITGVVVTAGGIAMALLLPSVIAATIHFVTIMPFLGVPFWVGVAWKRANRYGAWVSAVGSAIVYFGGAYFGWSVPMRSLASLIFGLVSIVLVSALTTPEPEESLERVFVSLHTPVGFEHRLPPAQAEVSHG